MCLYRGKRSTGKDFLSSRRRTRRERFLGTKPISLFRLQSPLRMWIASATLGRADWTLTILRLNRNHKNRESAQLRYTGGTRVSSNSLNSSAYIAKSFMLLAQNSRASSDNRKSSLPCVQNCRAASRAYSQTSNVFAVACGSTNSRAGTCPSPVGAYSIETWSNAGARRKRDPSAKNSMLY